MGAEVEGSEETQGRSLYTRDDTERERRERERVSL